MSSVPYSVTEQLLDRVGYGFVASDVVLIGYNIINKTQNQTQRTYSNSIILSIVAHFNKSNIHHATIDDDVISLVNGLLKQFQALFLLIPYYIIGYENLKRLFVD